VNGGSFMDAKLKIDNSPLPIAHSQYKLLEINLEYVG
jgi:hypothetical protein